MASIKVSTASIFHYPSRHQTYNLHQCIHSFSSFSFRITHLQQHEPPEPGHAEPLGPRRPNALDELREQLNELLEIEPDGPEVAKEARGAELPLEHLAGVEHAAGAEEGEAQGAAGELLRRQEVLLLLELRIAQVVLGLPASCADIVWSEETHSRVKVKGLSSWRVASDARSSNRTNRACF